MGASFGAPEHNLRGMHSTGARDDIDKTYDLPASKRWLQTEFVERFVYIDNVFTPEITIPVMESMAEEIEAAMELNVARWPHTMNNWKIEIQKIRSFLNNRGRYVKNHVYNFFGIHPKEVRCV